MNIFAALVTVLILAGVLYGLARFLHGLVTELALFAVEAWRDIEIRQ